jgi:hypothetical protein
MAQSFGAGARKTGGETVSRTSKYYQRKTVISRQVVCQWCGAELKHANTGRPKRFCSTKCRAAYNRAMKQHAQACVEAALAGEPEPPREFGQPARFAPYEIDEDGDVTKQARPVTKGGLI